MSVNFNKIIINTLFNLILFFVMIIGVQNSSNKAKINFIINETIYLPVGFIIGTSFIFGSITGSLVNIKVSSK